MSMIYPDPVLTNSVSDQAVRPAHPLGRQPFPAPRRRNTVKMIRRHPHGKA